MYLGNCNLKEAAKLSHKIYGIGTNTWHERNWGQLYRIGLGIQRMLISSSDSDLKQLGINTSEPVHVIKGDDGMKYPFILMPDYMNTNKLCLMSPFCGNYGYNRRVYENLKSVSYTTEVTKIPVIFKHDVENYITRINNNCTNLEDVAWRDYLKKEVTNNYISHFFGEKGKRVQWTVDYSLRGESKHLIQEHIEHSMWVASNSGEMQQPYSIAALLLTDGIHDPWDNDVDAYTISATDTEDGSIICQMQVIRCVNGFLCRRIVLSHDQKYRPYSLVSMANLVAIKEFMLKDFNLYDNPGWEKEYLDLGVNFNDSGDYKSGFTHKSMPLYNFPSFDSINTAQEFLNGLNRS